MHRIMFSLLIFVYLTAAAAEAADPLFLRLPSGVADSDVMKVVANALNKREWEVKEESPRGVVGHIEHDAINALIEIYIDDGALYYRDLGTERRAVAASGIRTTYKQPPPERWISFLRSDVERAVGLLDRTILGAGETASKENIAARLAVLKSLHDDGLINDEEYAAKRREILNEI